MIVHCGRLVDMRGTATVRLRRGTKQILDSMKAKGETIDDVVCRLIGRDQILRVFWERKGKRDDV